MAKQLPVLVRLYIVWGQQFGPEKIRAHVFLWNLHNMWVCEQAKRQLEIQTGIKAQVILPTPGQKTNRQTEQTKSSLGPKEKSVVPEPLFEHHTFATPVREILQLPKTTGKNLHPPMKPRGKQWKHGPLRNGKKWSQKVEGRPLLYAKKPGPYPIILNKTGRKQKITVKQENI